MTKQEYEAAIQSLDMELYASWLPDEGEKIADKRHELKEQYIASLEAENAKLEKLNSAALERLSYHACPSDRNNYGQPCNDSDDCVACWREYLGGKDE